VGYGQCDGALECVDTHWSSTPLRYIIPSRQNGASSPTLKVEHRQTSSYNRFNFFDSPSPIGSFSVAEPASSCATYLFNLSFFGFLASTSASLRASLFTDNFFKHLANHHAYLHQIQRGFRFRPTALHQMHILSHSHWVRRSVFRAEGSFEGESSELEIETAYLMLRASGAVVRRGCCRH